VVGCAWIRGGWKLLHRRIPNRCLARKVIGNIIMVIDNFLVNGPSLLPFPER
jgi:hypothetical protein